MGSVVNIQDRFDGLDKPMAPESVGDLRQKIGETHAMVLMLIEAQKDRTLEARAADDRIQAEIRNIKHDARNMAQLTTGDLEKLRIELQRTKHLFESAAATQQRELDNLNERIKELSEPVEQLVNMRRSIVAVVMIVGAVGSLIFAIISPIWGTVVNHLFSWNGKS